jgi:hypothetical protein
VQWIPALGLDPAPHVHGLFDAQPFALAGRQPTDGFDIALGVKPVPAAASFRRR